MSATHGLSVHVWSASGRLLWSTSD